MLKKELGFNDNEAVITYAAFHLDTNQSFNAIKFLREKIAPFLQENNMPFHFLVLGKKSKDLIFNDDALFSFPGYLDNTKELSKYMAVADICVSPITVRNGVKSKTITYMGYKKAVLSTPEGTNGLQVKNEEELLVSRLEEFPENLLKLIKSPNLRESLGIKARNFVANNFSYDSVFGDFGKDLKNWSIIENN